MNKNGVETIPLKYDSVQVLDTVLIIGQMNGLYGVAYKGVGLYPPKFAAIGEFEEDGRAAAQLGDDIIYIFLDKKVEAEYLQALEEEKKRNKKH